MPKVGFFVQGNKVNKHGFATIKAVVSIINVDDSTGELKYVTRQAAKKVGAIKPKHWHKINQRAKPNRADEEYNNSKEINDQLETFQRKTNDFIQACIDNGTDITVELIRKYFDGKIREKKDKPKAKTKTLWEAWDEYLKYIPLERKNLTVKANFIARNYFKHFEKNTGTKVSFENITPTFGDKFKAYVLKEKEHSNNYLASLLRRFKTFLNWCITRKYFTGEIPKNFTVKEKLGPVVFLSVDEFRQLWKHEFKSQRLERVRDIFCFGCLTGGLRISDLKKLDRGNIQNGFIIIYMEKGSSDVKLKIPIMAQAQKIIDKYKEQYLLLPKISGQKFNDYIKEAAKEAGLNRYPILKSSKDKTVNISDKPLHEWIKTHMMRKTFVSLSYKSGMPIEEIKKITGIKQEKTIKHYLEIDDETLVNSNERFSNLIGE